MINEKEEVNGWSNYATWRIALECFDNEGEYLSENEEHYETLYDFAEVLKESVENMIDEASANKEQPFADVVAGWAYAFINEVDYREIAEHILADYPSLVGVTND